MGDIFESLPKLFVDKILKKMMKSHVQIVAQSSKFNVCKKDNQKLDLMYNAREKIINILSYVNFANYTR